MESDADVEVAGDALDDEQRVVLLVVADGAGIEIGGFEQLFDRLLDALFIRRRFPSQRAGG